MLGIRLDVSARVILRLASVSVFHTTGNIQILIDFKVDIKKMLFEVFSISRSWRLREVLKTSNTNIFNIDRKINHCFVILLSVLIERSVSICFIILLSDCQTYTCLINKHGERLCGIILCVDFTLL